MVRGTSGRQQITEDFCLLAIGENSDLVLNFPLSKLSGETSQDEPWRQNYFVFFATAREAFYLPPGRLPRFVETGRLNIDLSHQLPYDPIKEAARQIAGNTLALEHLNALD